MNCPKCYGPLDTAMRCGTCDVEGLPPATGSESFEKMRDVVIGAACMYACAVDWKAIHDDPITKPVAERMTLERLERLKQAAREYFAFVCRIPNNKSKP